MATSKPSIIFSWRANSVVNVPIIFAIIGFLFATFIFLKKGDKENISFHEILLSNKTELIKELLQKRINDLKDQRSALESFKYLAANANDSLKNKNAAYWRVDKVIAASQNEFNNLRFGNADTSIKYFAQYIIVNRDVLSAAIDSLSNKKIQTLSINVLLHDTCTLLRDASVPNQRELRLGYSNGKSLITFITSYSIFGFWIFFSIAQMTLWFLLIPLIIGAVKKTDDIQMTFDAKAGFLFCAIPFLFVGLFALIFYWGLIDKHVIEDSYALDAYNSKMLVYSLPGYFVAVLCFGAYLFLSNKLELLNLWPGNPNLEDEYKKLTSTFNFTFLCSAIVLSVFIFWVGILFNAINNTEAMRFYSIVSGKTFLNYDFVYLLGLMHSLLLLIFYIPVMIRFNVLEITQQQKPSTAGDSPVKKLGKGLVEILSTILLTASPLITSFVQKFISVTA